MPYWSNILVYADGRAESKLGIKEALRLAEHVGGKTTALDVLHYFPARLGAGLTEVSQAELLSLMREQRRDQLMEDVAGLSYEGMVEVDVTQGRPAFEVILRAMTGNHDLIVKTARGRDLKHSTSFGSTALHLVRKSPTPVLLVSPRPHLLEVPRVLCALDLDDVDARQALNRRLLASSRQLAQVYGADLHVVHVIDQQRTAAYRSFLAADTFERFASDRRRLLQEDLEQLLRSELSGLDCVHAHLLEGDPADHLVRMVGERRASHLVMGSVTRPNAGHLVGGLAEEVLMRVECSVLTLKPEGFDSPVTARVRRAT